MSVNAGQRTDDPTRIVILGAGFGGVYTFKRLHQWFHKDPNVELVLVSDDNYFLFTPLLHEVATGNVEPVNVVEPLRKVLGCCLAEFHLAQVCRVRSEDGVVETTSGEISYDYLVVAIGSEPHFFGVEGAEEHAFTLKSMSDAITLKNHVIRSLEEANSRLAGYTPPDHLHVPLEELTHFVIVGGGPTGVELAAELADLCFHTFARYYPPALANMMRITIVQRGDELVPQFTEKMRRQSLRTLTNKGVDVRFQASATKVTDNAVFLDTGDVLDTRSVIWTAGVTPKELPFDREVPTEKGKILVNQYLQLEHEPHIFAIGDISQHYDKDTGEPIPALAQVATKQGPYVADVIANTIRGKAIEPFKYHSEGNLLSLGKWRAAGEVKGYAIYGRFAWWLWRTIYLSKLISWSKKIKVAMDWTINLFRPRDISQLSEFEQKDGCRK